MERVKATGKREGSVRKLNTNGCCFLCLQIKDIRQHEVNDNGFREIDKSFGSFHSTRNLLHHLKINPTNCGDPQQDQALEVNLCNSCEKVNSTFTNLCEKLEKVQMEINHVLEMVHSIVTDSTKDGNLVQNYSKRMASDVNALSELDFVQNLRKEIENKSLKMRIGPSPSIQLTRRSDPGKIDKEADVVQKEFAEEEEMDQNEGDLDSPLSPTISDCPSDQPLPLCFPTPEITSREESASGVGTKEKPSSSNPRNYSNLNSAVRKSANGSFNCQKCDKTYTTKHSVWRHFQSVHLRLIPKCDLCNKRIDASNFAQHRKICKVNHTKKLANESDPKFKFICKTCGKRFDVNKKLWDHELKVHRNANRYACELCDKKFSIPGSLRNHWNVVHLGKTFCCRFCDKKYSSEYPLKTHEKKCVNKPQVKIEQSDLVFNG